MIEDQDSPLSIARQCALLGLPRSSYYYQACQESEQNLQLMRLIDEQHLKKPFYGYRRMCWELNTLTGQSINAKRVLRLMRKMHIRAVYPRPKTTHIAKGHRIFPYLLRGVAIERPNQVWSSDITYIPMKRGFMYLVAIIDWYSRYVIAWALSNNLERWFCIQTLEEALATACPEIFNTDQGSQFTSDDFTSRLLAHSIRVSMDGKGRALDNVFVERLWWSVKYEDVYLKEYADGLALFKGIDHYFDFYNHQRPHSSLNYATPADIYFGRVELH